MAKARNEFSEDILRYIDECNKSKWPKSFLIAVLQKIQQKYGYLSREKMQAVSYLMDIPSAKVSGVASFYHYFNLKQSGSVVISICMGTACFVKGAEKVKRKFEEELKIRVGETTKDGKFSLFETRCLGMCAMAPVVKIGEECFSKVTPDMVKDLLKKFT
ncbi:MAG: hypothetical protein A2888_03540 [Chlamydiae bacterium RIFCSPLOWO2_01_FULL_28_7]|nr:MAG: hypothetical protein A2888_03540 [Chlamydiae bacterium RIFCSPLOWO2_01_FULL_28_7]